MEKIKKIELIFENCEVCILTPDMFKYLVVDGIKEQLLINCFQHKNGEIIREKTCDEFLIEINKKGLEQETLMNISLKERLKNYKDIAGIAILYENDIKDEILVPWCDKYEFLNEYQEIEEVEDTITITINRNI